MGFAPPPASLRGVLACSPAESAFRDNGRILPQRYARRHTLVYALVAASAVEHEHMRRSTLLILALIVGSIQVTATVWPRAATGARGARRTTDMAASTFAHDPRVPASVPGCGLPTATPSDALETHKKRRLPYLNVKAADFGYIESRDRVYATVAGDSPQLANTLVEAVPRRKKVARSLPVGPNPTFVAIADDDRTAYVVIDGPQIQRVDLVTWQVVSVFTPQIDTTLDYPLGVSSITVAPGRPETVAISFYYVGITGAVPGVAVYDAGVRRPVFLPNRDAWRITFGSDANTLWIIVSGGLQKVEVTDAGLAQSGQFVYADGYFSTDATRYGDLFFTDHGRLVDPERSKWLAWFPAVGGLTDNVVAVDRVNNQVLFVVSAGYESVVIAYDLTTYRYAGYYVGPIYGLGSFPRQHAVCRNGDIALLSSYDTGTIVYFPRRLIKPTTPYPLPEPIVDNGQVRRFALPNNFFTYDAVSRKIYVTIPGGVAGIGNSVVPIDVVTGAAGAPVYVGSEPATVAATAAGEYVYVGLWGSTAMTRLRLPELTPDVSWDLYSAYGPGSFPECAAQIVPVPGQPASVAVLHAAYPWYLDGPGVAGIHVYDDGRERPASAPSGYYYNDPFVDSFQISGSGRRIFGLNNESTGFEFSTFELDASGVHYSGLNYGLGGSFYDQLHCVGDVCYTDAGIVIDGIALARIGRLAIPQPEYPWTLTVLPDPNRGQVYVLVGQEHEAKLHVFDIRTLALLASYAVPNASGPAGNFVLLGDDAFAFSTGDAIYFVPFTALRPLEN